MKTLSALLLFAFTAPSFAQSTPAETSAAPGCGAENASWQSFVGFNVAEKSAAAHFTAEAGGVYFFVVNDHADRGGENQRPAGMKLSSLDSDEAQLLMSKFGFSTSRARK